MRDQHLEVETAMREPHRVVAGRPVRLRARGTGRANVVIGDAYQPKSFERYSPGAYSALRPEPTLDELRIQRAYLRRPLAAFRRIDAERLVGMSIASGALALLVLNAAGVLQ